jgi:aspartate dehydrogenase
MAVAIGSNVGVGLIGCGAIGRDIAKAIQGGSVPNATVVALFDVDEGQGKALVDTLSGDVPFATDIHKFLATDGLGVVVECASPVAVRAHAKDALLAKKDLVVMSTGALVDAELLSELTETAQDQGCRLMAPSGAIGGIDAIRAAEDGLDEVTLTTTKRPEGLRGSPGFREWEDREITDPQVIYEGPAAEGVKLFPANVNVAATLSLAGLGPQKTKIKVVADPDAPGNVHQIEAKGDFGVMRFTFENRPHPDNPRTSYLAILSAIELLRQACGTGPRIGT